MISPDEAEEKISPGTLENRVRSEGWCKCGKYFADTGKISCLGRRDLDAVEWQRWKG